MEQVPALQPDLETKVRHQFSEYTRVAGTFRTRLADRIG